MGKRGELQALTVINILMCRSMIVIKRDNE
jgi:hypothetical protein